MKNWQVTTFLAIIFLVPQPSLAQRAQSPVELIVRTESSHSSLGKGFQSSASAKNLPDSLFRGVNSVSNVYGHAGPGKKKGGENRTTPPVFQLQVADSTALRRLRSQWEQHPDVRYAHPNFQFRLQSQSGDDPPILREKNFLADSLDHLRVTQALDGWAVTSGDAAVTIGVIDTGFYINHPDLEDQFAINDAEDINGNGTLDPFPVEKGGDVNGIDDDGNGYTDDVIGFDFVDRSSPIQSGEFVNRDPDPSADQEGEPNGHGTAVAAVASAKPGDPLAGIAGVAPDAQIVALRAFGRDGIGQSDDIAAAIMYGAQRDLDVLNLSFGRERAVPLIEDAIDYANQKGTVVVASAGNKLTDDPHYPSDYPNVLSVAWLGEDGSLPQINQSRYGIGVDLGAPGSNVYTADIPPKNQESYERDDLYGAFSGSSFSAPQVAGAVALLRSADPSLSPGSIRSILTGTTEDIEGVNWDHQTGGGLLNVEQALTRAYPARTEIISPEHNQGMEGTSAIAITGTAIDPAFAHYALYYAEGTRNLGERRDPWIEITAPTSRQILNDTLSVWSSQEVSDLDEGAYTLRLVTTLRDGRTIEDRRRFRIDRSPPEFDRTIFDVGRVDGEYGILSEIETDDVTRLRMRVQLGDRARWLRSEHEARHHGMTWADKRGTGGTATVKLSAVNTSGLTTSLDTSLRIPVSNENPRLFQRTTTSIPQGRLLPSPVDFDEDGLTEVLINQLTPNGLSDTLRTFEWNGSGFVPADTFRTGRFSPKDVGDTNGDGLQELLLQKGRGTVLFEQPSDGAFPEDLIFADTSRAADGAGETVEGSRLTNLDGDEHGEIVGTFQRQWTVLERKKGGFQEVARLQNPTVPGPDSMRGNRFDLVESASGDFDGDGQGDLLVGDRDGDLIVYEKSGDDQFEPVWTFETDRLRAGAQFAVGDFSGSGRMDFVTASTNDASPSITYYSVWRRTGDDAYERAFRLSIGGAFLPADGGLESADFDGDDRPEIGIAHPPSLLVLDRAGDGSWRVLYEDRNSKILGRGFLAADVSGTGHPSIIAPTNDGKMVRYRTNPDALAVEPPQWIRSRPGGPSSTKLSWRSAGVDSVTVYAGPSQAQLNPVETTSDSSTTILGAKEQRYALTAWKAGQQSPLSPSRTVRPHSPATVSNVSYPGPSSIELRFSEPLAPNINPEQFHLESTSKHPSGLNLSRTGQSVTLQFDSIKPGYTGRLTWLDLADTSGLAVGETGVEVAFPKADQRTLFVEEARILSQNRVQLAFSAPVDPSVAENRSRYTVRPRGHVTEVRVMEDSSSVVSLQVDGLVLGASGEESSLTVDGLVGVDGSRLSKEGATVRLTRPADDLSRVFIYPNPYRMSRHEDPLTIAGLPTEASIRIYTPTGQLVRTLSSTQNRNGGRRWDLRNQRGDRVSSGVYLFRINAPDESPVLEKAVVIR